MSDEVHIPIQDDGETSPDILNSPDNIVPPVSDSQDPHPASSVPEIKLTRPPPLLKIPTLGYMRTVQRRGNTYMIRDSIPSEEDPVESDGVDRMISDLYRETMEMSSSANSRAGLLKHLYVLAAIFITIAGAIIGALTVQGFSDAASQYAATVLGFAISGVQALNSTFSIQNRSVLLKEVSNRLRKVSRGLKTLENSEMKSRDKWKKLEEFYAEVDELDLNMFDNTITTVSSSKIAISSNGSRQSGSDLSSEGDPPYEPRQLHTDPSSKSIPNETKLHSTGDSSGTLQNEVAMNRARQFINMLQRRKKDRSTEQIRQSGPTPPRVARPSHSFDGPVVSVIDQMNNNPQ
jgi:hypothetical protein